MRNEYIRKGKKRSPLWYLLLILLAFAACFFFAKRYRDAHFVDRPKVYFFGQTHVGTHAECLMGGFFKRSLDSFVEEEPANPLLFSSATLRALERYDSDYLRYNLPFYRQLSCGCEICPRSILYDPYESLPPTGDKALLEAFDNFLTKHQDIGYTISVDAVYSQLDIYRRLRKKVEKNPNLIVCHEKFAGYVDLTKKGRTIVPSLPFLSDEVAYGANFAFDYWETGETSDLLKDFDVDEIERKFTNREMLTIREKKQLLMLCVAPAGTYAILYAQGIAKRGLLIGLADSALSEEIKQISKEGGSKREEELTLGARENVAVKRIKEILESEEEVAFIYGSAHNFRQYFPPREYDFQYASDPKIDPETLKPRTFDDYFAYGLDVLRRRGWIAEEAD